ncbi:MAG: zinc-ribbon domain-containing protein [Roseivirga sp.]|nr:zinc-ribbon domain-containing protein [Roseivirga sp.]
MIIFGTRGVKSTIKSGDFHCPQCQNSRPYRHRKVTKFFTLYFIPLIPLGSAGEYVECGSCKGTFIPRVLENHPEKKEEFMAVYEQAIKHSMVLIMLADGEIDENEMNQVLAIFNKFGNKEIDLAELSDYVKQVEQEKEDVTTYLKKVAGYLNEHGKETVIKCGLSVAAADGHVDDSELEMIIEMGKALDMTALHVKGIINEMHPGS